MYDKNNEDNNPNKNNTITNKQAQWDLESTRDITCAPHAHTQCQTINNLHLTGSATSYTGMGANRIESFVGQEVEQGLYPQEAATRVTPAMTDLLTTPQSGGQVPRIGHGSRRNYQQARGTKLTLTSCSSMREWHKQPIVHGNGRSALRQRSNATTDHDTWRVRRRRQRYKHRGSSTRSAQSLTNHIGQS